MCLMYIGIKKGTFVLHRAVDKAPYRHRNTPSTTGPRPTKETLHQTRSGETAVGRRDGTGVGEGLETAGSETS